MSEERALELGLSPLARIVEWQAIESRLSKGSTTRLGPGMSVSVDLGQLNIPEMSSGFRERLEAAESDLALDHRAESRSRFHGGSVLPLFTGLIGPGHCRQTEVTDNRLVLDQKEHQQHQQNRQAFPKIASPK